MSTKSTITYGERFHLYTDCFDEEHVWLSLDQPVEFEVNQHSVTVRLPLSLWEHLRTFSTAQTDLAAKTDAELRAIAEGQLAEKRRQYLEDCKRAKEYPRRSLFHISPKHRRAELRDPAKALAELILDLRQQRTKQRQLLAEIERFRNYPILAAARQRRENRRIEKRHEGLLADRCKPHGQFEKDFVERHNPTKPRRPAGRGSTSHQR